MTITVYDDAGRPTETRDAQEGRHHHHRRRQRPRLRRRRAHRAARRSPASSASSWSWADAARTMKVRANADTPLDARTARALRRRGHRPVPHRAHVLRRGAHRGDARDDPRRRRARAARAALAKLLPVPARGLRRHLPRDARAAGHDPPARSAAPRVPAHRDEAARGALAGRWASRSQKLEQRTKDLHEFNPMLGHRGCRLAITYPEIYAMQVRAILEAAVQVGAARASRCTPRS